jgi:site-specific recombinase XerD
LSDNGATVYTPKTGLDFLSEICGITAREGLDREQRWAVRSVQYLNDALDFGTVFPTTPAVSTADSLVHFGVALEAFKSHQQKRHSVCASTLYSYEKHIGKFLLYLEHQNTTDLSCITVAQLHDCCKMIAKQSDGAAHNMSCSIRVFLRYLHTEGILREDLSGKVPSFAYRRQSKLPSSLEAEEMTALLASVDRASRVGKRDYAIILLACRLGLRSGDIRTLRFGDISWERNTIEIVTQKTGKPLTLPLLDDVGQAIIDYAKYARPTVDSPIIFQTCNAPIGPLSAPAISSIVKRYANKAAIDTVPGRHPGPHLLRNTLASALLRENVPLPEISGILVHADTRTTQEYYLRIDINQLKRCALDPPAFSWEPTEEVF